MKKKVPSKVGEFVKNHKEELLVLVNKKLELVNMILEYNKSKNELEIAKEALIVKREEIKSREIIELQKIKSSLEEKKAEYEFLMKNRELEHKEKMEKLEMIKNELENGNTLINKLIEETKDKEFKYKLIDKFYELHLELIQVLKDL